MDREPDHKAWMSLRLSRVLDDIGVNRSVVRKRRETFLLREAVETLGNKLSGSNMTYFYYGRQSEGSLTPWMISNNDMLQYDSDVKIMSDWTDWEVDKMCNFLMVNEETTPPQHYWLQSIRRNYPEPVSYNEREKFVLHVDGRVFLSKTIRTDSRKETHRNYFLVSDPSVSFFNPADLVPAYICKVLPPEVKRWFDRPKSTHWPTKGMMQAARECSCFLVPDRHFEVLNESIQWRLSPSQVERILDFSLTTVQLKCYVVLKMIKRYITERYLRHNGNLTTFHCKTAMFFTVERISPAEWREDRLIECIGYCLQTLKMFLMKGHLPHYIIPDVNLLVGKLTRSDQLLIVQKIKEFLNNNLMILYDIQIDNLGQRLRNPTSDMFESRSRLFRTINTDLSVDLVRYVTRLFSSITHYNLSFEKCLRYFAALFKHDDVSIIKRQALSMYTSHICSYLASVVVSFQIAFGCLFTAVIFYLYECSLDTDVTPSRLKLASMLYCSGNLHMAVDVLNHVECIYDDTVHAVCSCGKEWANVEKPMLINDSTIYDWSYDDVKNKVALCVRFTCLEAFCIPPVLIFEMNRAMNDDVQHRTGAECTWMDMAVVDSKPFLFYLQYLTYRGMEIRLKQVSALRNLTNCFTSLELKTMHHIETAANLLGHCCEMEENLEMALRAYMWSIMVQPRNNAANWHIRRLLTVTKQRPRMITECSPEFKSLPSTESLFEEDDEQVARSQWRYKPPLEETCKGKNTVKLMSFFTRNHSTSLVVVTCCKLILVKTQRRFWTQRGLSEMVTGIACKTEIEINSKETSFKARLLAGTNQYMATLPLMEV